MRCTYNLAGTQRALSVTDTPTSQGFSLDFYGAAGIASLPEPVICNLSRFGHGGKVDYAKTIARILLADRIVVVML